VKPKPPVKPKPHSVTRPHLKPNSQPKPKPRPEPKLHPKHKTLHESAERPMLASLNARAKPVSSRQASVSMEEPEAHKSEQVGDTTPAPKNEISKAPPSNGLKETVSDETVQDILSDYPEHVSGRPEQGSSVAGAELGSSGSVVKLAVPLYLENPPPKYPELARSSGFQGTVILEVMVKENGKAGHVRVSRSSGYPSLDRAAAATVKKWIFKPGSENGAVVDMRVKIPIRFKLD
jgi:protein TonB